MSRQFDSSDELLSSLRHDDLEDAMFSTNDKSVTTGKSSATVFASSVSAKIFRGANKSRDPRLRSKRADPENDDDDDDDAFIPPALTRPSRRLKRTEIDDDVDDAFASSTSTKNSSRVTSKPRDPRLKLKRTVPQDDENDDAFTSSAPSRSSRKMKRIDPPDNNNNDDDDDDDDDEAKAFVSIAPTKTPRVGNNNESRDPRQKLKRTVSANDENDDMSVISLVPTKISRKSKAADTHNDDNAVFLAMKKSVRGAKKPTAPPSRTPSPIIGDIIPDSEDSDDTDRQVARDTAATAEPSLIRAIAPCSDTTTDDAVPTRQKNDCLEPLAAQNDMMKSPAAENLRAWSRTATLLPVDVVSVAEGQICAIQQLTNDHSCWSLLSMLDVGKCLREFPVFDTSVTLRLQLVLIVERVLRAVKHVSVCARICKIDVQVRRTKASVEALRMCVRARRELEGLLHYDNTTTTTTTITAATGAEPRVVDGNGANQKGGRKVPKEMKNVVADAPNDDDDDNDAPDDEFMDFADPVLDEEEEKDGPIDDGEAAVSTDDMFADNEQQQHAREHMNALLQAIYHLDMSAKYFLVNAYQAKRMTREVRFLRECKFTTLNSCFNRRYENYLFERLSYGGDRGEYEKTVRGTFFCPTEHRRGPNDAFERILDKSGVLSRICSRYIYQRILNYPLKPNGEVDAVGIALPRVFVNISPRKKIDVWNVLTTDADLATAAAAAAAASKTAVVSGGLSAFTRQHHELAGTNANGDGASSCAEIGVLDLGSARFCVKGNFVAMKGYTGVYLSNRSTRL